MLIYCSISSAFVKMDKKKQTKDARKLPLGHPVLILCILAV
jgi:hypothetical protein